jgi:4-hydroxy-tetrahydrodipicolinate synthase
MGNSTINIDLRGLTPAPVTPFTKDGHVDYDAIQRLGSWLGSIDGVKGLVVLGHAGEGTFLTQEEQASVITAFVKSVDNKIPIIAGITTEGTEVAALEAKRAKAAGASAGLLYPSHGWLRFGYQNGAPQDRYRVVYEVSCLPLLKSLEYSGDCMRSIVRNCLMIFHKDCHKPGGRVVPYIYTIPLSK